MNRMIRIAVSIFSLAGAVSLAHAEEGVEPGCVEARGAFRHKRLERFDADRDGKLSEAERAQAELQRKQRHEQRRAEMRTRFDLDKDGVLDDRERAAMRLVHAQRLFGRLDLNADGRLSRDEVRCGPLARRFDAIDLDHSGSLSEDELQKAPPMHHGGPRADRVDHATRKLLKKHLATV